MKFEIPELNTLNSLDLANQLNELTVNESFSFSANMKWVRPFGMLFTSLVIKQFRNKYIDIPFELEWNNTGNGINYAGHMGFFKSISEKLIIGKMPGEAIGNNNYIPIIELDLKQMHQDEIENGHFLHMGDVIENESSRLAKILSRGNNEMHALLTYLIREILRNIPEHSDSSTAWICGQYWSDGSAEIAIIDEGIGIKNSLQQNMVHRKYINTDEDALECAIKAGISQAFQPMKTNKSDDMWANSGFGLYMVSEICKELEGSFCLATGNKYIYSSNDGGLRIGNTAFQGTAVKITISTSKISNSKAIIAKIAKQGEVQASTIRNAFKTASIPSKRLIIDL